MTTRDDITVVNDFATAYTQTAVNLAAEWHHRLEADTMRFFGLKCTVDNSNCAFHINNASVTPLHVDREYHDSPHGQAVATTAASQLTALNGRISQGKCTLSRITQSVDSQRMMALAPFRDIVSPTGQDDVGDLLIQKLSAAVTNDLPFFKTDIRIPIGIEENDRFRTGDIPVRGTLAFDTDCEHVGSNDARNELASNYIVYLTGSSNCGISDGQHRLYHEPIGSLRRIADPLACVHWGNDTWALFTSSATRIPLAEATFSPRSVSISGLTNDIQDSEYSTDLTRCFPRIDEYAARRYDAFPCADQVNSSCNQAVNSWKYVIPMTESCYVGLGKTTWASRIANCGQRSSNSFISHAPYEVFGTEHTESRLHKFVDSTLRARSFLGAVLESLVAVHRVGRDQRTNVLVKSSESLQMHELVQRWIVSDMCSLPDITHVEIANTTSEALKQPEHLPSRMYIRAMPAVQSDSDCATHALIHFTALVNSSRIAHKMKCGPAGSWRQTYQNVKNGIRQAMYAFTGCICKTPLDGTAIPDAQSVFADGGTRRVMQAMWRVLQSNTLMRSDATTTPSKRDLPNAVEQAALVCPMWLVLCERDQVIDYLVRHSVDVVLVLDSPAFSRIVISKNAFARWKQ